MKSVVLLAVLLVVLLASTPTAAIRQGIAERSYAPGDIVQVRVNSLRSLSTLMPYSYYHLPFCKPTVIQHKVETLGEVLWGDRVQSSVYNLKMLSNTTSCQLLKCPSRAKNAEDLQRNVDALEHFINEGYRADMTIDNLPLYLDRSPEKLKSMPYQKYVDINGQVQEGDLCAGSSDIPPEQRLMNARGYAIGVNKLCTGKTLVNNHLHFNIEYSQPTTAVEERGNHDQYVVVGFTAIPHSVKHSDDGSTCTHQHHHNNGSRTVQPLTVDDIRENPSAVWWSYSVSWTKREDLTWDSRWDAFLATNIANTNATIHYMSIVNSFIMGLCLLAVLIVKLSKMRRSTAEEENKDDADDGEDNGGWKCLHADVFRPPSSSQLLAGLVGNGVQLVLTCAVVLALVLFGIMPIDSGTLLTSIILLFVLFSFPSGIVCGWLLKDVGKATKTWIVFCGGLFPTLAFVVFSDANWMNHHAGTTTAVPFMSCATIAALWIAVAMPMTVLGGSFGLRCGSDANGWGNVADVPREVPAQRWCFTNTFLYAVVPMVPLGVISVQLQFVLSSLWFNLPFYAFGFFAVSFMLWIVITALVAMLVVCFQLCKQNYKWWWTSFAVPGCFGGHLVLYSVYYFFAKVHITTVTGAFLYFSYMLLISLAYGLASGAVGFLASLVLVRKLYRSSTTTSNNDAILGEGEEEENALEIPATHTRAPSSVGVVLEMKQVVVEEEEEEEEEEEMELAKQAT